MIVLLICEPRSGSTNLANWFYFNKSFTTIFEPTDPKSKWYQNEIHPKEYQYKTKHLCIKEVYYPEKDFTDLIGVADKIIVLYRENYTEQLESFLNSVTTNNWHLPYVYKIKNNKLTEEKSDYFKLLKTEFKEKYLNKEYFQMTYEDLYYKHGIESIKRYLNLEELNNKWPVGEKYRVYVSKTKNII